LAPDELPKAQDFPDLDFSRNDHLLVAEALAFAKVNQSISVKLLTADVGPMRTAKRKGLLYEAVPRVGYCHQKMTIETKRLNYLAKKTTDYGQSSLASP
jgi:hypothetical protein